MTFQLQVQIAGETGTYITGAADYGQAVHNVEAYLEAGGEKGNILKVAPKPKIIFVPIAEPKPAFFALTPEEMEEGSKPDTEDIGF